MSDLHKLILDQIKQPLWENWYIKEEIGRGATGVVYRIEADRSGRREIGALKVVPIVADEYVYPDPQKRSTYIEKKKAEAQNETNIMYDLRDCPYIVGYRDETIRPIDDPDGSPGYYMLIRMEMLTSIQKLMKTGRFDCSENNVRKLAHDIGGAIKAAHDIGVIHRDIKPGNFFVNDRGVYKLGDFNISKKSVSTRSFAGTEGFIAPEIYRARYGVDAYTNQADIYSFGISLYCMMNDMLFPFGDTDLTDDAITRRMNGEPLPLPKNASPAFAKVILKACAFKQEDRYKTIGEMLRDMENMGEVPAASSRNAAMDEYATVLVNDPDTELEPAPNPAQPSANSYNSAANPFVQDTLRDSASTPSTPPASALKGLENHHFPEETIWKSTYSRAAATAGSPPDIRVTAARQANLQQQQDEAPAPPTSALKALEGRKEFSPPHFDDEAIWKSTYSRATAKPASSSRSQAQYAYKDPNDDSSREVFYSPYRAKNRIGAVLKIAIVVIAVLAFIAICAYAKIDNSKDSKGAFKTVFANERSCRMLDEHCDDADFIFVSSPDNLLV